MAGHSKWNNIKRVKGAQDAKKGALLSRISKEIIIATNLGGSGDPNFNTYLRVAISKAKAANMTNEKIEKAISKGLGRDGGDDLLDKTYEISGFYGAVILVDCETDNSNRTLNEIKAIVGKEGAKLVPEGSLSWSFREKGRIHISVNDNIDETVLSLVSFDGIIDLINEESDIYIFTEKESIKDILDKLKSSNLDYQFKEANVIKDSKDKINLYGESLDMNLNLIDKIKSHPDVVYLWDNIKQ